jgi:hypothetical protein
MRLALVRRFLAPYILVFVCACSAAAPVSPQPRASTHFVSTVQDAAAAYDRGDYHVAAVLYGQIVRKNSVNPTYWRRLAASHYLAGE